MVSKLITQTAVWIAAMAAVLIVAAGTVRWPAAWVFLAEMAGLGLAIGFQAAQKTWDKVFMVTVFVLWTSWLVLMALDAGRFGWSRMPVWAQGIGAILIALCMTIACLAFRENSYAAPVVKIARDRGHRVVSIGPYACVRHPMYAGALLFFVGTPLLLGSWYGLAATPVLIVVLAARAVMEERTLAEELPGYREYAQRVRYRLIPGVW